jgi:hypothetical protein
MVFGDARDLGIIYEFNRVGTAGVLSESRVIIIDKTGLGTEDNILEN